MTRTLAFLAGLALGIIIGIYAILVSWPTEPSVPFRDEERVVSV